jgi:hypothetical protein
VLINVNNGVAQVKKEGKDIKLVGDWACVDIGESHAW